MAKVTEYSRITKMKDNDVLLVDGPDGTRTILQTDASKQMGGEVIMVNETAGDSTKVVINTTDEEIELATMADLEPVEEDVSELKTHFDIEEKIANNGSAVVYPDIMTGYTIKKSNGALDPLPNDAKYAVTELIPVYSGIDIMITGQHVATWSSAGWVTYAADGTTIVLYDTNGTTELNTTGASYFRLSDYNGNSDHSSLSIKFTSEISKSIGTVPSGKTIQEQIDDIEDKMTSIYVTPEMYAEDGVTDWSQAIQAAVNTGKKVVLTKQYSITTPIELNNGTNIEGFNGATIIAKSSNNTGINCFEIPVGKHDIKIEGINIIGVKTDSSKAVACLGSNYRINILNVYIESFLYGVWMAYVWNVCFINVRINGTSSCMYLENYNSSSVSAYSVYFRNCSYGSSTYGLYVKNPATNLYMVMCKFDGVNRPIQLEALVELIMESCGFERYVNAIRSSGSGKILFNGGHFYLSQDTVEDFSISGGLKIVCINTTFSEGFDSGGTPIYCINCDNAPSNSKTVEWV